MALIEPEPKRIKSNAGVPMSPGLAQTICLLPAERLLREFLLEGAKCFPGLEIWVTGGWVRDRLLNTPSSDLDLALSSLTGKEFGTFLESFSARPDVESKYRQRAAELGIPTTLFTRFHVMKKNANMSKKLETAGGKLFGLDIDLVNLRKEVYDGLSRNPDMEFGTAEEDAFRRDATVNALFFHLERQEVVDLTGRGLTDLQLKIMRTPLDPRQTFMDDPLRILRLIRIGSKLGFALDPKALSCMREAELHQALNTIITRDRVGCEVFQMMRSSNPEVAFQHIDSCNLYTPVFLRPNAPSLYALKREFPLLGLGISAPSPGTWFRSYQVLSHILRQNDNLAKLVQSEGNPEFLWTMAAYTPLAGLRHSMLKDAVQDATDAIRAPTKIAQLLECALTNYDSIDEMVHITAKEPSSRPLRSVVGMAVRSWGSNWAAQVTYAMLSQAVYASEAEFGENSSLESFSMSGWVHERLLRRYSSFADFIDREDLRDAHLKRPLLNGTEIQAAFGLRKGGKYIKAAMDELIEWQFDHKEADAQDATAWLISQKERLQVPADN